MNFSPVTKWSLHSRKSLKLSEPHIAQRLMFSIKYVSRETKGANIVKVLGAGCWVLGAGFGCRVQGSGCRVVWIKDVSCSVWYRTVLNYYS